MQRNQVLGVAILLLALLAGAFIYNAVTTAPFAATHPQATLDFEHHPENDSLTVIHRNGESFDRPDTQALEVYVSPVNEAGPPSPRILIRPAAPRTPIDLPFARGDTATITNVTANDELVILWRGRSESHLLWYYSVQTGENR